MARRLLSRKRLRFRFSRRNILWSFQQPQRFCGDTRGCQAEVCCVER